jgi:hypothetical protein
LCLSLPDVFAVLFDDVLVIDVGRVVGTSAAVDVVLETVRSTDRVIVWTTEQIVVTETAIYAVSSRAAQTLYVPAPVCYRENFTPSGWYDAPSEEARFVQGQMHKYSLLHIH